MTGEATSHRVGGEGLKASSASRSQQTLSKIPLNPAVQQKLARASSFEPPGSSLVEQLLVLQSTAGNDAVQRLLARDQVSRTAPRSVQRQTATKKRPPVKKPASATVAPSRARELERDMRDVLRDWHEASGQGVELFVGRVLSERIDKIESGSWKNYLISMLGNTIWAAACFINPEFALAVFAVAMTGIAIGSIPGIPSPTKSSLPEIQKAMLGYLNTVYDQVNGQLPGKADLLAQHVGAAGRFEAIARFIQASFRPEMQKNYAPYTELPQINRSAVTDLMYQKALYEFRAAEQVEPAIASATQNYSQAGRAIRGLDDDRRKFGGGYIIYKDRMEGVAHRYAARAQLDLSRPENGIFDKELPGFEGAYPPTTYFHYWLSHAMLNEPPSDNHALTKRIVDEMNRIPLAMDASVADQKTLRRDFLKKVQDASGDQPVSETMLRKFRSMSGPSEIGDPVSPDLYDKAVPPVYQRIMSQLDDLRSQAANADKPAQQRQEKIPELIKFEDE